MPIDPRLGKVLWAVLLALVGIACEASPSAAQTRACRVRSVTVAPVDGTIRLRNGSGWVTFVAQAYDEANRPCNRVTFRWSSSNVNVARVAQGDVEGVAPGNAIIAATTGVGALRKTAYASVTVAPPEDKPASATGLARPGGPKSPLGRFDTLLAGTLTNVGMQGSLRTSDRRLRDGSYGDLYRIETQMYGVTAKWYELTVETTSFDPYLAILDDTGQLVAENDDADLRSVRVRPTYGAARIRFSPRAGRAYYALITNVSGRPMTGSYWYQPHFEPSREVP